MTTKERAGQGLPAVAIYLTGETFWKEDGLDWFEVFRNDMEDCVVGGLSNAGFHIYEEKQEGDTVLKKLLNDTMQKKFACVMVECYTKQGMHAIKYLRKVRDRSGIKLHDLDAYVY